MDNKPMCGKMRTALLVPQHASVTANLPHAIVDIMANLTNNNDFKKGLGKAVAVKKA